MTSTKVKDANEYRKMRRLWGEGETFKDKGVKLVMRSADASKDMTLPLEPLRVKAEYAASGVKNPFKITANLAGALGLTDTSFLEWFEHAAPLEFKELIDRWNASCSWAGSTREVEQWLEARRKAPKDTRADRVDWETVRRVLVEDRAPMDAAVAAGCAGGKIPWSQDAAWIKALEDRGLPTEANTLPTTDRAFSESIRAFLKLEVEPISLAEVYMVIGLHPESMKSRLRARRLIRRSDRDEVREIVRRWLDGESVSEIAEATGCGEPGVRLRVAEYAPRPSDKV